jgi:hypothetical protein
VSLRSPARRGGVVLGALLLAVPLLALPRPADRAVQARLVSDHGPDLAAQKAQIA